MKTHRTPLFAICLGFSLLAICFSLFSEFVWKIETCTLCKLQRLSYVFIAGFSAWGLWKKSSRLASLFIQAALVGMVFLSGYHLMVQMGILSNFCALPKKIVSIDDFERMLEAPPLPCSKVTWRFLGLPLPAYNLGFSCLFLLISLLKIMKNH
jgi:disulfide bond formation protein DsbB